jgi:hypothetical protein
MAKLIQEVRPGEIISADLWNQLVTKIEELDTKLAELSGNIITGSVTVPNVFGKKLSEAKSIIGAPTLQLALGNVIDAFGNVVSPNQPATANLIVINQLPAPGAKVFPGSSVNLVVAATGSTTGSTQPPLGPKIDYFDPAIIHVGREVEIVGKHFDADPDNNVVTFDGVEAVPSALSTIGSLFVIVPSGIPGAPKMLGQPNKPNVNVIVSTPTGQANGTCTIAEPLGTTVTITDIYPNPGKIGQPVTIEGKGFARKTDSITVTFNDVVALNPAVTATEVKVTIPKISGLKTLGTSKLKPPLVAVVVKVGAVKSNKFPLGILGITD